MTISANFPSIRPSLLLDFANSKALDPRVSFSRPTTATYYDNHTTVVAEQNLAQYSQDFDNGVWTKNAVTVTANSVIAPDGTTTAESIVESATTDLHVAYQTINIAASLTYTFSCYLKANTRNYGMIRVGGGGVSTGPAIKIDLTNGTVTTIEGTVIASSATLVGSGWYRCVLTFTSGATAAHTPQCGPHNNGSAVSYTGDGTSGIYIWGAQLEQRSAVTAYTPTTTTAITNYIPVLLTGQSNEARFDHNPTTRESLGLLIEESRSNLLTYSEDFSNAVWTKATGCTVSSNANIAPDGTQTADAVSQTTNGDTNGVYRTGALFTSGRTVSLYLKAGEITSVTGQNGAGQQWTFNLTTGLFSSVSSVYTTSATSVGNGWWRIQIVLGSVAGTDFFVGATSNASAYNKFFIWGAQLEAGSFATSYIPTVASQVTRSADSASIVRASWFNIAQGTFYAEVLAGKSSTSGGYGTTNCFVVSSNSASPERLGMYFDSGTACTLNTFNGANSYTATSSTVTAGIFHKVSCFYETSGIGMVADAGTVASTSGILPVYQTFTNLNIGQNFTSGNFLNGYIKKLAYYPIRVTNAQLQGLTGS